MYDIKNIRNEFPILKRQVNGCPLIYFDNAATSQKPKAVIDAIIHYYTHLNSNIHRGVHVLSQEATDAYEASRMHIKTHINAKNNHEVIFTSGATESLNLVASCYSATLKPKDEVIISALEHHSNIVPWQLLSQNTNCKIRVIPMLANGTLDIDTYKTLLNKHTKLVVVNHVSNALGVINPIDKMVALAHEYGAKVMVDGAQAMSHFKPNVQKSDVDFYSFSGHKMYGPTGIGVLYGKSELLETFPPYKGGGEMISEVTFEKSTYADLPHKFEAGTPNIEGGIVLKTAFEFMSNVGFDNLYQHERHLLDYATESLESIPDLFIYGNTKDKVGAISFNIKGVHPYDLGTILNQKGIAIRTGHHCAQPIMDFFNISGTLRVSFAVYNTTQEIDYLIETIKYALKLLK